MTIEKTAEDILGYNDEKIIVYGCAYERKIIQKDETKGLDFDYVFKLYTSNIPFETSNIFEKICKMVE